MGDQATRKRKGGLEVLKTRTSKEPKNKGTARRGEELEGWLGISNGGGEEDWA